MPKASKATASQSVQEEGYEGHFEHFAGGLTVGFESFSKDEDLSDSFAGLPGNRCPCPHWGYVMKGRVVFRYADHQESYGAGDAYYAPPGHTPVLYAGTQIVEFSPTSELKRTMEVMAKNQQAGGG